MPYYATLSGRSRLLCGVSLAAAVPSCTSPKTWKRTAAAAVAAALAMQTAMMHMLVRVVVQEK